MKTNFEIYQDKAEEYRWRAKAKNGEIIAISGEGFSSQQACEKSIDRLMKTSEYSTTLQVQES